MAFRQNFTHDYVNRVILYDQVDRVWVCEHITHTRGSMYPYEYMTYPFVVTYPL